MEDKEKSSIEKQTGFTPEEFNRLHRTGHIKTPQGPSSDDDYIEVDPNTGKPPRRFAKVAVETVGKKPYAETVGKPKDSYAEDVAQQPDRSPNK